MLKNESIDKQKVLAEQLIAKQVKVPEGYVVVSCLLLSHDSIPVFVFRYQQSHQEQSVLGGEHFSVSVDLDATKIMGFIHIEKQHCGSGLPSEDQAKAIAAEFLPTIAPDLVGKYEIKWVMAQLEKPNKIPHESPFPFVDLHGEAHLVTGMRVKLFFEQLGTWGWVIVGRDNNVISFEREVNWNTIMNRRSTPGWLHDSFIQDLASDIKQLG